MKLPIQFIYTSIRWKFLLPLGCIVLLVTIHLFLFIFSAVHERIEIAAKKRADLLIHSLYTASYLLKNPKYFQQYVLVLGQYPGLSSIVVYSDFTDKVVASTEPALIGHTLDEISNNQAIPCERKKIKKNTDTYFIDLGNPYTDRARRRLPAEVSNTEYTTEIAQHISLHFFL
jgi:hypothetical protein